MAQHCATLLMLALTLILAGHVHSQNVEIAIVTYLGNDFILKDGCPLPECNARDRACVRRRAQTKAEYDRCVASDDKDFHGCVTDGLTNGDRLTVPVYASYCSGQCYEKDENDLQKLERCPFVGERHELSPALQRRLGVNL